MINVCWYFFKVGLVVALVGGVATGVYLYVRMDDEIRVHVEGLLADRFPQFKVSVGGARLVEGKGIAVYDVSLAALGDESSGAALLAIDELLLCCDVELATLVQGAPPVHQVEIKRPQVFLRRSAAGRWNFESLLPMQPCGACVPKIVIRGGELSVIDSADAGRPPVVVRDIELTVAPVADAAATGGLPSLRIDGVAGGAQVRRLEVHAAYDAATRICNGNIAIHQLQAGEALFAWIEPMMPPVAQATRVTGMVDGAGNASWRFDGRSRPEFTAKLALSGGRLSDPRLSEPVTELVGDIVVDAGQLKVEQMRGKWKSAAVAISLNRVGWAANAKLAVSARVDDAPLDEDLCKVLATAANPPNATGIPVASLLLEECEKYRPTGFANATVQATFDGVRWSPTATLEGRQLAFESDKFAYRLTDGAGTIVFTPADANTQAKLQIKLTAVGGGQRLRIDGEVTDPRPGAAGWVQIQGEGLEIEDRMIAALKETPRQVIASLHPSGKFNLTHWRIDRPQAGVEPQTSLRLDLTDVRINYEHFPYALREIRGVIEAKGNEWAFSNLISGGRRTIYGEGFLQPAAEGHELWLKFTGQNVPLDDNLFYALQPPVQEAWKQLRPTGSVNLTAEVRHRVGQGKPSIGVVVQPAPNSSLRPVFFSYPMDDVSGTIAYNDGEITLHEVKAHDDTGAMMGANGKGYFSPDGGWEFTLNGLWADRRMVGSALLAALPPQLSRLVNQLRPNGFFSLHDGELTFRKPASAIATLETAWDVQLESHRSDLSCGVELRNVTGAVQLVGRSDGQRCDSSGELDLETVTYQDVQFTNVRGPFWVDESQCHLGRYASNHTGQQARHLSGNVYGGAVAGDGWVHFGVLPQYGVEAALTGADLNRLIVERFGGRQTFQGKMDAQVMLKGEGSSMARLAGDGNVHIREANIYELPLLMGLLQVLRTGAPDKTAFNQSDIKFRIQGPHVYLDQIDFLGDVVDLYGYGETDFDQNIKLIFRGEFGPREYHIPLVKNIVGQMSQQVMQMYVDGTLTDPHVTKEAFPEISQMLKQIRTDLETPAGPAAARQAQRDMFGRETSR